MDRRSVITSLKALRLELGEDCQVDLAREMPEAMLMLSDVCAFLGLSDLETAEVLGSELTLSFEKWQNTEVWPALLSWGFRLRAAWAMIRARLWPGRLVIGPATRADLRELFD